MNKYILPLLGIGMLLAGCENGTNEFPDYNGGTVYFARQTPVRTLVMGDADENTDNSADNAHKCYIYATMAGTYGGRDITLDIAVDPTLVNNLYFEDGSPVQVLPSSYYQLGSNKISYNGDIWGCVEVSFTDAFFSDPAALKNTYVIPVVINSQTGAENIFTGTPLTEGTTPQRTNSSLWSVQPKDYVLYCVKYVNKYDAVYLRRGTDVITEGGATRTNVRHNGVENDELATVGTRSLNQALLPVTMNVMQTDDNGQQKAVAQTCQLLLTFGDNDQCTITSATEGIKAQGTGSFVSKGEKKAWGNKDRDALYLDYTIDYGSLQMATKDTLVVQTRNIKQEYFSPTYKE